MIFFLSKFSHPLNKKDAQNSLFHWKSSTIEYKHSVIL